MIDAPLWAYSKPRPPTSPREAFSLGGGRELGQVKGRVACIAAAMCLILTAVEGEGYWRLTGTAGVVDAAAGSPGISVYNESAAKNKKPLVQSARGFF